MVEGLVSQDSLEEIHRQSSTRGGNGTPGQVNEADTRPISQEDRERRVQEQLDLAKKTRTQAELARQNTANAIVLASKELAEKIVTEAEQRLSRAKRLEAQAEARVKEISSELERAKAAKADAEQRTRQVMDQATERANERVEQAEAAKAEAEALAQRTVREAEEKARTELDRAEAIRQEADAYAARVKSDAEKQVQEWKLHVKDETERECEAIKQRITEEAQQVLSEAEMIRAAAQEELEAQRIYAQAAQLEAESRDILEQVRSRLVDPSAIDEDFVDGHDLLRSLTESLDGLAMDEEMSEQDFDPEGHSGTVADQESEVSAASTPRRRRKSNPAKQG